MIVQCEICPHSCKLKEGQVGICHGRIHREGKVESENYGRITSLALDPIEKKPLNRYYPGSMILSVGSYGCNLRCPFCQNCEISTADASGIDYYEISVEELVEKALELVPQGNIGLAYTYNEPFIGYEFIYDCATQIKKVNLKNIVVTGGYINEKPLKKLLPFIDAMNIDLKGFSDRFYKMVGGDLPTVKRTIELAATKCHVEITTLIIPGENDSEEEMRALSNWLSQINPEIPLHISRFFPRHKMKHLNATPINVIYQLAEIAREKLTYVYEGNV